MYIIKSFILSTIYLNCVYLLLKVMFNCVKLGFIAIDKSCTE